MYARRYILTRSYPAGKAISLSKFIGISVRDHRIAIMIAIADSMEYLISGLKVTLIPDQDLFFSCPGMHFFGTGYFLLPACHSPPGNKKYPGPKQCIPGHEKKIGPGQGSG